MEKALSASLVRVLGMDRVRVLLVEERMGQCSVLVLSAGVVHDNHRYVWSTVTQINSKNKHHK